MHEELGEQTELGRFSERARPALTCSIRPTACSLSADWAMGQESAHAEPADFAQLYDRVMNWIVGALLITLIAAVAVLQAHPPR